MRSISPAYVAGLVDGEGCVTVEASHGRYLYPRVYLGMTAKALALLEMVRARYGGSLRRTRAETDCWSAAWMLSVVGLQALAMLRDIEPHLILKAEQARLAIGLGELLAARQALPRGRRWDEATELEARRLMSLVRELNRKGPTAEGG